MPYDTSCVLLHNLTIHGLFALIRCDEHAKHLAGSTMNFRGCGCTVSDVQLRDSKVTGVVLGRTTYALDTLQPRSLSLSTTAAIALGSCTPELENFFRAFLSPQHAELVHNALRERITQEQTALKERVLHFARLGNLKRARQSYAENCAAFWPQLDFENALRIEELTQRLNMHLKTGSLHAIDRFYNEELCQSFRADDIAFRKIPVVQSYLKDLGQSFDEEQIRALTSPCNRLQIRARAGSGKTLTLAARAALAILDEKIHPNQVLILAFNKAAAKEIKSRVQKLIKDETFKNSRTFHSLAYQLVKPKQKLLFNAGGEICAREQSQFAQRMLSRILNPAFKEEMVEFFRQELEQIETIGRDLPPKDYYAFRRALDHVTLGGQWIRTDGTTVQTNGEHVKSVGEKIIADFLFEHDIPYRYERAWMWKAPFLNDVSYKPDFSLHANGYDIILEHWALDPEDEDATLPDFWNITADEYRAQIAAKRAFWSSKGIRLLETHTGMLHRGRRSFENQLKSILESSAINCTRLPQEEVIKRVFQNDFIVSRMAELFVQFISRAKKIAWNPDEVASKMRHAHKQQRRAQVFYRLALRAYREYEQMKTEEAAMDFDDLLLAATDIVKQQGPNATIHLGQGDCITLGDIRWILLDEYQDFNHLYYMMVSSILSTCPNIRLVAVGDDWQAINSFSGAQLSFFDRFSDVFPGGETVGVRTNYRSTRVIVENGNRLMSGLGTAGKPNASAQKGRFEVVDVSRIFVQFVRSAETEQEWQTDQIFLPEGTEGRASESALRVAQALKCCVRILRKSFEPNAILTTAENAGRLPHVLILARTRYAYGLTLPDFRGRLVVVLARLTGASPKLVERLISTSTAHSSKGLEAHTVIVLDATERQFPKVHPDNMLFSLFGATQNDVLEEERRLFYVAITRATKQLVVFTDLSRPSPYLACLTEPSRPPGNT